ncbi:hypothetical protein RY831_24180 [Noviherbaspirillum sp. CPCC 100848]|uniref:Uncharacterized protein n=1 Tax=Noviherbaspirillum album TaxID=3080276 RepID=A0ABU6JF23_9BURK|nr:hypothetical protein [Noviherbaspirillum sp. CPCC 100848]MEC4722266.1 hypothetical protein [Noviherbaspirillum sp. CPCC 100848]
MKNTLTTLLATLLATLSLSAIAGRDLQTLTQTGNSNQAPQQQNGQPQDTSKDMEQMMKSCAEMMNKASK